MDDTDDLSEDVDVDDEDFDRSNYPEIILKSLIRQFYCCSGALLLPLFGAIADNGVFAKYLDEDYVLPLICGEIVGFVLGGIFVSFFGRKLALIISNLFYFVIISVSSSTAFEDEKIHFTPILVGILFRFTTMAFIFYVAEISDVSLRAFFLGFYYTVYYFGHYYFQYTFESKLYQSIQLAALLAFISSVLSLVIPETPYYLASKGDFEKAEDIFQWVRAGEADPDEYDMMLEKAENSMEPGRIMEEISSSTFVVCLIMGILLKLCNFNACELYQDLIYALYLTDESSSGKSYLMTLAMVWEIWIYHAMDMFMGGLVFLCISFVMPRKIIYGIGFILTLLFVVPVVLTPSDSYTILTLFPYCFTISFGGREPLAFILPAEILPTILRPVGLIVVFSFEKMIQIFLYFTSESPKISYILKRTGKYWIVFSYSVSLIGIPFLLMFMPETKDRSIFELETLTVSFADTWPGQDAEEGE